MPAFSTLSEQRLATCDPRLQAILKEAIRLGEDPVGRPSTPCSVSKLVVVHSGYLRPFSQRTTHAIMRNEKVSPVVSSLFGWRRPFAIRRFITNFVVNSVESMPIWGLANIGKEVGKRPLPPIANKNSPSAIASPEFVVPVCASLDHASPDSVRSGVRHSVRHRFSKFCFWTAMSIAPHVVLSAQPTSNRVSFASILRA